jgi:serine/threonine protein kinase
MGVVYRARQRSLNRLVALKMLLGGTHAGSDFKKRFRQEAKAVAQLQHPGIVQVYEIGDFQGQLYYSMELVCDRSGRPAPTLNDIIRESPMLPTAAARILVDVADAVHYAHHQGIVHRDLKPSNILVGPDGRPRVTDFGLARRLKDDSSITSPGQALGTPGFLPPEQAGGTLGAAGVHSDVYSLGAVLYCLMSGRPPFLAGTIHETLHQVLNSEPVPLRRLNSALPADLDIIAAKCPEKDPSRRYSSTAEFSSELQRFLEHRPIEAVPAGTLERVHKWRQRNPVVAGLLATVLVVFGAGFGTALWQWQESRANAISTFQARDDAEALVDFMMKDLKRQFEAAGKLEILDGVQKRVADYYRGLPPQPRDPTYRKRQATFLRNQGNLWRPGEIWWERRAPIQMPCPC